MKTANGENGSEPPPAPEARHVQEAALAIVGVAHRTPVATCRTLDARAGR
ncbi:MAG: serine dehydratase, partial [Candidatus Eisenbacteria bacterium]|nr:serine dehydratase [Candidatus Latescibacterota bacterium]MBD3301431.1 serine dehydratase [Candidatus Eisenbacteria bacterium]